MKKTMILISILILLVGCQTTQTKTTTQANSLPPPEQAAPATSQAQENVQVSLASIPETIKNAESMEYSWKVEGGTEIAHTNIHTSFTEDFAKRTDSEKQPGTPGTFKTELTLESDSTKTVYVKAHANVDGKDYTSQTQTRELEVEATAETAEPVPTATAEVTIEGFSYNEPEITINSGDTVTWTQKDGATHTVTGISGPESFKSGNLVNGETFSQTFTTPGEYKYQCSIHPNMKGKIVVA